MTINEDYRNHEDFTSFETDDEHLQTGLLNNTSLLQTADFEEAGYSDGHL